MNKICFAFKRWAAILAMLFFLSPAAWAAPRAHHIAGQTMGTTYHITVVTGALQEPGGLRDRIQKRLDDINRSMSTYRKDSEISRFNALAQTGRRFKISDDFYRVMQVARRVYRLSEGAWDGTVYPLVSLWGFNRPGAPNRIPSQQAIAAVLPAVGFASIQILAPGYLVKTRAGVSLDLASIAKGYGVDQVAALIGRAGLRDYLVEIGGEVFAAGHRPDGKPWRIGINTPLKNAPFDQVYKVVNLHDRALATSGDYRNYFEIGGVRYSHVINPATGYPVANDVASVSIVAGNCTLADGLATAVMVMGVKKGLALINRLPDVEGLIVVEKAGGRLVDFYSRGFKTAD